MDAVAALLGSQQLAWQALGGVAFVLRDASSWSAVHYVLWAALIVGALELLSSLVSSIGRAAGLERPEAAIKPGAAGRLESFEAIDWLYITINKGLTALFSYHALRFAWDGLLDWSAPAALGWRGAALGVLAPLPALYIIYDAAYAPFHRALHHGSVYALVHKHHHRQKVPFRGNYDAINVHPFEFVSGEYNHLAALYIVCRGWDALLGGARVHVSAALLFIVAGGVLASLNHTRFALSLSLPLPCLSSRGLSLSWLPLWRVDYHDLHHHNVAVNFAQYIPLWDAAMGTLKAHPDAEGGHGLGKKDGKAKAA